MTLIKWPHIKFTFFQSLKLQINISTAITGRDAFSELWICPKRRPVFHPSANSSLAEGKLSQGKARTLGQNSTAPANDVTNASDAYIGQLHTVAICAFCFARWQLCKCMSSRLPGKKHSCSGNLLFQETVAQYAKIQWHLEHAHWPKFPQIVAEKDWESKTGQMTLRTQRLQKVALLHNAMPTVKSRSPGQKPSSGASVKVWTMEHSFCAKVLSLAACYQNEVRTSQDYTK